MRQNKIKVRKVYFLLDHIVCWLAQKRRLVNSLTSGLKHLTWHNQGVYIFSTIDMSIISVVVCQLLKYFLYAFSPMKIGKTLMNFLYLFNPFKMKTQMNVLYVQLYVHCTQRKMGKPKWMFHMSTLDRGKWENPNELLICPLCIEENGKTHTHLHGLSENKREKNTWKLQVCPCIKECYCDWDYIATWCQNSLPVLFVIVRFSNKVLAYISVDWSYLGGGAHMGSG